MKKIDRKLLMRINQILGVVCLAAMFFSHLALTDILHGEPDAWEEWLTLRATAVLLVVYIGMTLWVMRAFSGKDNGNDYSE